MKNQYQILKDRHHKEFNAFPLGAAFSQTQFTEMMAKWGLEPTDTDKILHVGAGCYIRKTDREAFHALVERLEKEKQDAKISFNNISLSNIDFRYGNHELVLKNVSFEINKGEKVAIVGESGCGKTTLAKLLLKFYFPENGKIMIDGNELNSIPTDEIRNNISHIDQNTFLFSDTIKNNLTFGNRTSTVT